MKRMTTALLCAASLLLASCGSQTTDRCEDGDGLLTLPVLM